jgi:hypothetical protein
LLCIEKHRKALTSFAAMPILPVMKYTTVRVSNETHKKLKALKKEERRPILDIVDLAVTDRYERVRAEGDGDGRDKRSTPAPAVA